MSDTILLDILMPGIDGFETCRILKNNEATKHIPVLLVSVLGQNYENRIKGLNMGPMLSYQNLFRPDSSI